MNRIHWIWLLVLLNLTSLGCSPRVRVIASPGPKDQGVRYYRPKPYLLVEPSGTTVTDSKKNVTLSPSDEFVSIRLEYLPDFSEEYAINVSPGLGDADVKITLEDGWNLTSLNQDLDSQFDENVTAISDLAKAAAGFVPSGGPENRSGDRGGPLGSSRKFVVPATNVPIGYYESILSRDSCGRKRLQGWRYIGFVPFAPCPVDACATTQTLQCDALPSELFGLVFRDGAMQFRRLNEIPLDVDQDGDGGEPRKSISYGEYEVTESTADRLLDLERAIQRGILQQFGAGSTVTARFDSAGQGVQVSVDLKDAVDDQADSKTRFVKEILKFEGLEDSLVALGDPALTFETVTGLTDSALN